MFSHKGAWSSKGLIIQINFRSALTLVDSAIADSSESDCELQTPAEARFWDQKLSYCYTSGLLLHNFLSVLCESVLFDEGFSTEIHFQAICCTLNWVIFLASVPFSQFYEKLPSTYTKCWSGVDIAKKIYKVFLRSSLVFFWIVIIKHPRRKVCLNAASQIDPSGPTSFKLLDTDVLKTHWGYVLETILLAEKLETKTNETESSFH